MNRLRNLLIEGFALQYPEDAKVDEIRSLCEKLEIDLYLDQVRTLDDIKLPSLLTGLLSLLLGALVFEKGPDMFTERAVPGKNKKQFVRFMRHPPGAGLGRIVCYDNG